MELDQAVAFARARQHGVVVTIRRDGRPQLSNIIYLMDQDGSARISVTETRAKTKNLRRDHRAQLYVPGDSFWEYAVLEGSAQLSPPAADPDDEVVDELVELYRAIRGEDHPDWDDYRRAMVEERRVVLNFRPTSAYGQLRS
ncbi:MAG TPA: PPOX class F420-dependent oxidoreductase [Acidimicrobiia bacterium]|nr:PPOX class F420-dependent oxidoreductase [Acidimicrobiia bacterium]